MEERRVRGDGKGLTETGRAHVMTWEKPRREAKPSILLFENVGRPKMLGSQRTREGAGGGTKKKNRPK